MPQRRIQGIRAAEVSRQLQIMERTVRNLAKSETLSGDEFSDFCNRVEAENQKLKGHLNELGLEVDFKGEVLPKRDFQKSLRARGTLSRVRV